jgi:alpha-L-fucosidase
MAYKQTFRPTLESIRTHSVPQWYNDAKLGIFIHWGLYSVPAFAPPSFELGEVPGDETWFCNNPYAEWYLNSIRVRQGPTWEHHVREYGADFDYSQFSGLWKAKAWDPSQWADLFAQAGAEYVVLTTKHHDGFCLWPSKYTDYNSVRLGPKRDIMGELTRAVRRRGLRMGAYYSGLLDWNGSTEPIFDEVGLRNLYPMTFGYADYAYSQVMELIDLYEPSVLWNDIGWPGKGEGDLPSLFAHYYNTVEEGVVNDRWNDVWCDFTTKEYKQGEMTTERKWEMCRGLGLSFGYNAEEDESKTLSATALVSLLVSTVANNGNLLINVGPMADGLIPPLQESLLLALGSWLSRFGEAIFGTRPWKTVGGEFNGIKVWFTRKTDALYLLADELKGETAEFTVGNLPSHTKVEFLGGVPGTASSETGTVTVRAKVPSGLSCIVLKISGVQEV